MFIQSHPQLTKQLTYMNNYIHKINPKWLGFFSLNYTHPWTRFLFFYFVYIFIYIYKLNIWAAVCTCCVCGHLLWPAWGHSYWLLLPLELWLLELHARWGELAGRAAGGRRLVHLLTPWLLVWASPVWVTTPRALGGGRTSVNGHLNLMHYVGVMHGTIVITGVAVTRGRSLTLNLCGRKTMML